jgi:hypothetical protein
MSLTFITQGEVLYSEDFTTAPSPVTGSGLIYYDGSSDEHWVSAINYLNFSGGNLTLNTSAPTALRGRGAAVWLDASEWADGTVAVQFDVSDYTGATANEVYFQAYYANGVAPGNRVGFDLHQGAGVDLNTNVTGAAQMGTIGSKNVITANGTDLEYTFEYSGQDYIALVFYSKGDIASFDNIAVTGAVAEVELRTLWENDMSTDPTDDGWVERNADSNYSVGSGVLTMTNSTLLDTVPYNELKGITKADLVWRSITEETTSNGWGSFLWFNIDSDAPESYPVHFDSIKTNDSQTVKIFEAAGQTVLASHEGFGTNMLTLSATLDGFNKTADYIITDGTLSVTNSVDLVGRTASGGNPVTLGTKAPVAEVDYVRIEANARPDEAALVAEGDVAIELLAPATTTTGSVWLAYGTAGNDLEITAYTVSDESHGVGSFNVVSPTQTLASASYATNELEVAFDNSVANLSFGTATGLVTVTWTETGTGVTNDTVVAVSATVTPAANQAIRWNGNGNGVNWGDPDNWDADRVPGVYAVDRGLLVNGDTVTVATNFTGNYTYEVTVRSGSTLDIAADLKNIDDLNVAVASGHNGTVNQTAGAVDSAVLNISIAGSTGSPVYNLSGGTHEVSGDVNINSNGVLNVDGGALTVDQFLFVNEGALLSLSSGAVTSGIARASNENNLIVKAGGAIEISGGTFYHNSRLQLNSGGTVRFIGSGAGLTVNQLQSYNGTHKFVLYESGVGSMVCRSWGKLAGCTFEVDGSAYTNGPADIVLFSSAYHATANSALGAYTVTGLGAEGVDWTITEENISGSGRTVTLKILGVEEIGDITMGGVNEDGDLVFSWDTVDGQIYNVETNANLVTPNWGILETIVGDGGTVSYTNTPLLDTLFYIITSE